jgi:lactate permease
VQAAAGSHSTILPCRPDSAEVGKPVAPQTTSVGVSTSSYVRREGEVIRHNFGWTLVLLGYLILIGIFYYYVLPDAMRL